jgi:hypothetical protein
MRDWLFIAAPTRAFGVTAFYVIQDHPAYIPRVASDGLFVPN